MQNLGLNEIREKFLAFFESKNHLRHPSFPLVPQGDASLLLINSGMAPLKPYFSGEAQPPHNRMTTCQKCIRTPDIERVGKTARHGTFFEMLGNFSFGDYFKQDAAKFAWEFCTVTMGLPPEKLYVSVYLDDDEAWDIWTQEVGIDPAHMVRLGKADNFWEIGAGPCGPCSEIYYDNGPEKGCGSPDCAVGCDCDRYVEFWNLVFTQFNNDGAGNYTPLARKNIDTGMGLERLACILQGVDNLFEVDTVTRIREHITRIAGVEYHQDTKTDVSIRVVTDHIRSTVMLVSDGVLPANEGRGYVLRRLLRRAARHGRLLGIQSLFLHQVAETVIAESAAAYPELREKQAHILSVIRAEEERFAKTIDAGLAMFRAALAATVGKQFPGESAFKLYDTFGFPLDLTRELLEEQGFSLDENAFDALMKAQRERARAARAALGDKGWESTDLGKGFQATTFVGYSMLSADAAILALAADGQTTDRAEAGQSVTLLLDTTPFYAESGGQTADVGVLTTPTGRVAVENVQKSSDGKFFHIGTVEDGEINVGETVGAQVDVARRAAICRAHSTTHLLQKALRDVLGDHVQQAGSLVLPDRIRFDFSHPAALTKSELAAVAAHVEDAIYAEMPIHIAEMPIAEAKTIGAMALFGEKYGDVVRVVQMGDHSVELCGGTHLTNTIQAGCVILLAETSVGAGVRRIEAVTGRAVTEAARLGRQVLSALAERLKSGNLEERIEGLLNEVKEKSREINALKQKAAAGAGANLAAEAKDLPGGLRFLAKRLEGIEPAALRGLGDSLRAENPSLVAVLAAGGGEKTTVLVVCGADAVAAGAKAGAICAAVCKHCGGAGGGKPESAMGGARDADKLTEAFGLAKAML